MAQQTPQSPPMAAIFCFALCSRLWYAHGAGPLRYITAVKSLGYGLVEGFMRSLQAIHLKPHYVICRTEGQRDTYEIWLKGSQAGPGYQTEVRSRNQNWQMTWTTFRGTLEHCKSVTGWRPFKGT